VGAAAPAALTAGRRVREHALMRSSWARWAGAVTVLVTAVACASEPTPEGPAVAETVADIAEPAPTSTVPASAGPTVAPTVATPVAPTPLAPAPVAPTTELTTVPATVAADAVVPEGFDLIGARVTMADGTVCELCLWLAASGEQRSRGLMFVTDLAGADGMAFRYESPHSGGFWMKNTVLPLSIAFYAADGAFLDAFDMEPCTADPCPTYPTPDGFLVAVETYQGGLAGLGMEPGSTLQLSDLPCA
jgi:uncharacterized membrane protein (UPF0127 family)